ncbi:MAG: serine hydrolase [Bacteroidota bacterium]
MKTHKDILIFASLLLIFTLGCQKEEIEQPFPHSDFISTGEWQGDYWPTNGWRTCRPEEVGMDSEKLEELNEEVQTLLKLHIDIQNVLIVKNGYIVAEQYFSDEYGPDSLHRIHSCTKSITSALMGIAVEQGFISDVNIPMTDFFPDYEIENLTAEKQQITLEHLLTMSAGFEWYEMEYPYDDERNTFRSFVNSENRVKFVLDRPMSAPPGEEYSYNTGISHVLSAIIERTTGMRTDSLAVENLFNPLGIKKFYWPIDAHGVAYGGNGMRLTSRDMAKFGYLYLKNGLWEGNQVVPKNWIEESQKKHIPRKYILDYYYGYQWWVSSQNSYSAVGYAGQWITIFPEHDLVIVFSNQFDNNNSFQWSTPERLVNTYILPAVK